MANVKQWRVGKAHYMGNKSFEPIIYSVNGSHYRVLNLERDGSLCAYIDIDDDSEQRALELYKEISNERKKDDN